MSGIDWKERGTAFAQAMSSYYTGEGGRSEWAARSLGQADDHEGWLRERFADLLAAVRWTGMEYHEDFALRREAEALRLLVEGFRERLTEISGGASK